MPDMDRNAILKQMGITQWVLRDTQPETPAHAGRKVEQRTPEDLTPAHPKEVRSPASLAVQASEPEGAPSAVVPARVILDSLREQVSGCSACELAKTRNQTVFGEGPEQADWLFVGEAPGQQEDRQGKPFVGRAGGLLTQMVRALDKSREQVYIANTLKCRPPNNRDPLPTELKACEPYLLKQIEQLRPQVMVALGRISAQALLKTDQPLGKLRGRVHHYGPDKIPLIVTYHPAYLLRQPAEKGKVWADLLLAHRQIQV